MSSDVVPSFFFFLTVRLPKLGPCRTVPAFLMYDISISSGKGEIVTRLPEWAASWVKSETSSVVLPQGGTHVSSASTLDLPYLTSRVFF